MSPSTHQSSPTAYVASASSSSVASAPSSSSNWFLDSATTSHMTNDLTNLSYYQPYSGPDQVAIGDGNTLPITHTVHFFWFSSPQSISSSTSSQTAFPIPASSAPISASSPSQISSPSDLPIAHFPPLSVAAPSISVAAPPISVAAPSPLSAPAPSQVDMIVLTDGSCILGLGDLGVQGTGIPIGKLDMYVAAAGINPQRHPQLEGKEYLSIVDEFMEAIHARRPKAIVQWAFERLQRYQKRFCMLNDDMQGTAGVGLAGLLGTVRAQGRPLTDFVNQKIVVVGAGRWLGLITTERKGAGPAAAPFAKAPGEIKGLGLREGANLVEVPCFIYYRGRDSECYFVSSNEKAPKIIRSQFLNFALALVKARSIITNQVSLHYAKDYIPTDIGSDSDLVDCVNLKGFSNCFDCMANTTINIRDITAEVGAAVVRAVVVEELAEGHCDVEPRELSVLLRWILGNSSLKFWWILEWLIVVIRHQRYGFNIGQDNSEVKTGLEEAHRGWFNLGMDSLGCVGQFVLRSSDSSFARACVWLQT
ncbi:hypothetical protein HYC85_009223 [Camellia sinensis]|uniref:Malic enzyme N-terminal domain-containing protein n=1 Tax=Camellia sinensis TaxID=4442 RepID=A0A7J7HF05_CAMSI|nr:hypothetical protein HYC85_009223 [Camellia sinensis]